MRGCVARDSKLERNAECDCRWVGDGWEDSSMVNDSVRQSAVSRLVEPETWRCGG